VMFYMWAGNVTGSHAGLLEAATATVWNWLGALSGDALITKP
jgi:hypothetical protein